MKNAKKIVMGGVAALALVTASVMGTMAYFTSKTETVKNTFTVGNVTISLDETKTTGIGKEAKKENDEIVKTSEGNSYKLYPGETYLKDPTIHVAENSETCYLFVRVENGLSGVEVTNTDESKTTIASQLKANGWTLVPNQTDVYYLGSDEIMTKVDPKTDHKVFESFKIDSGKNADDLEEYKDASIKVTAGAVQTQGIANTDIETAWNAISPLGTVTSNN